jgi:hypothetical protein
VWADRVVEASQIMTMFDRSGVKGALFVGKVKLVVVAATAGRQSSRGVPHGRWMTRKRSGAGMPRARASMPRNSGTNSAVEPPHAPKNERRAIL